MKKLYILILSILFSITGYAQDLIITGVVDGPLSGGVPKSVEVYVNADIADLSSYAIGVASNGNGSDGPEFALSGAATAGDFLYITYIDNQDRVGFNEFFGFDPDFITGELGINGDDTVELYDNVSDDGSGNLSGNLIDVFGFADVDGSGESWEYLDGWAYRINGTGPDGTTFMPGNWSYSGPNALDGETTNTTASNPFPLGTYTTTASAEPSLTLLSPSDGDVLAPFSTAVDVEFSTMNVDFDAAGNQVDITVNGTLYEDVTSPFNAGVTEGSNTILIKLLVGGTAVESETESLTVTVPTVTNVGNIAALRAGNNDGTYYNLTGEAIVTFTQSYRNQKYIEDATAAVVIDDAAGVITTDYTIGDGVTGIVGTLSEFRGLLQFLPVLDPGAASSTGNNITPQEVTFTDLSANPESYEAEVVKIMGVTFDDNTGVFETNKVYALSDGSGAFEMWTTFYGADYIGEEIPDTSLDPVGVIVQYDHDTFDGDDTDMDYYFTPRSADDLGITLGVENFIVEAGSRVYPNPVSGGIAYFKKPVTYAMYDMQGRKVSGGIETREVKTANLNPGVYVITLASGASQRLIVR